MLGTLPMYILLLHTFSLSAEEELPLLFADTKPATPCSGLLSVQLFSLESTCLPLVFFLGLPFRFGATNINHRVTDNKVGMDSHGYCATASRNNTITVNSILTAMNILQCYKYIIIL
ncbi:hypothetical protein EB796_016710 [Bugula neritina]|uniref:Uncharacterized protein n=1 Tax=Bugula neritina TaxID=10212 RepID=A0A7J7JFT0_BUGNE|nr:hypothetical protein EB796_016710 [Bugula neritina]